MGTLLELECSRGRAVGHLLSGAITMDCNMKLLYQHSLLPSLMLPSALATEAYQLLFDPLGSNLFCKSLSALLEKAGEVASLKRHQSLEEAIIKSAKGTKGSKLASKRSPSGVQQKQGGARTASEARSRVVKPLTEALRAPRQLLGRRDHP